MNSFVTLKPSFSCGSFPFRNTLVWLHAIQESPGTCTNGDMSVRYINSVSVPGSLDGFTNRQCHKNPGYSRSDQQRENWDCFEPSSPFSFHRESVSPRAFKWTCETLYVRDASFLYTGRVKSPKESWPTAKHISPLCMHHTLYISDGYIYKVYMEYILIRPVLLIS